MTQSEHDERRHFHRIPVSLHATLHAGDNGFRCKVVDVSLRGVLLSDAQDWEGNTGDRVSLVMQLDQLGEARIHMQGEVVHARSDRLGVKCHQMDLESATLLRRLVELNLADPDMLERELAAMIDVA